MHNTQSIETIIISEINYNVAPNYIVVLTILDQWKWFYQNQTLEQEMIESRNAKIRR